MVLSRISISSFCIDHYSRYWDFLTLEVTKKILCSTLFLNKIITADIDHKNMNLLHLNAKRMLYLNKIIISIEKLKSREYFSLKLNFKINKFILLPDDVDEYISPLRQR